MNDLQRNQRNYNVIKVKWMIYRVNARNQGNYNVIKVKWIIYRVNARKWMKSEYIFMYLHKLMKIKEKTCNFGKK